MAVRSTKVADKLAAIEERLRPQGDQHLDFLAQREKIARILELIEEKDVLVLGHNYMAPLVYSLSGERERGDSLALSRRAAETNQPVILFDGVRFMAETAKILSPEKKVLIADPAAGCSLADPFGPEDVREYRARYPGAPVVTYVNSYAAVKAESDYCCTSANAIQIVKHAASEAGSGRVIFFPDSLMARNIENDLARDGVAIEIAYPGKEDERFGRCEVHEQFTAEHIREIRRQHGIPRGGAAGAVLVHWECPPEVVAEADYCGSTSGMAGYLQEHPALRRVYLATECEMAANLACEFPAVEFVRTCNIFCQHMRLITLDAILHSLEDEVFEIEVPEPLRVRAKRAIDRMLAVP
jgi:quinolinate synthase